MRSPGIRVPLDEGTAPARHGAHDRRHAGPLGEAAELYGLHRDGLRRRGERLSIRHDAGESAAPYVAGTLLAVRAVGGRTGLTRGLDQLLG